LQACIVERERIGREIHDTISQDLAGANYLLRGLEAKLTDRFAEEAEDVARVVACIDLALDHLRAVNRGLGAVRLSGLEFITYVRDLCGDASHLFGVTCRYQAEGELPPISDEVATHLYCVVREALCNAIRHGRATEIDVSLNVRGENGELTVTDNGNGFCERAGKPQGLGLRIMQYRAKQVGGSLAVTGLKEGGAEVKCSFFAGNKGPGC
jgi:signal transduction histidine kinase